MLLEGRSRVKLLTSMDASVYTAPCKKKSFQIRNALEMLSELALVTHFKKYLIKNLW